MLASGRSERQVKALAEHTRDQMKLNFDLPALSAEGLQAGRWALIDFGDIVVHIFKEDERDFYDLEGLWRDAQPVDRASFERRSLRASCDCASDFDHSR